MTNKLYWLLEEYNVSMAALIRRPLPRAGTAMLLYRDGQYIGISTVDEPFNLAGLAKGNYRVYHVDVGRKSHTYTLRTPTADGYQMLDVKVTISFYTTDPRALLENRPDDIPAMLEGFIERVVREVTQSKHTTLQNLAQAETWIASRIVDQAYPFGIKIDHTNPTLGIPDSDRAHYEKQRSAQEWLEAIEGGEDVLNANRLADDPAALVEVIQTLRGDRQQNQEARFKLLQLLLESGRFEDIDLSADGRGVLSDFIAETMGGSGRPSVAGAALNAPRSPELEGGQQDRNQASDDSLSEDDEDLAFLDED